MEHILCARPCVPCGLLKLPHFILPSTLGSRYHECPHFQVGKSCDKELKHLALIHLASKFNNLASNPDQLKSKTYTATIRQKVDMCGFSYK